MTGKALAEWKYQQYMHDYMRVIHSVDRNVGRVLDYMEKSGLLENTIIVYTSDQGFYMGEHGWFDKRFMYEESFRTPMLVRFPGGVKGDIPEMVQNTTMQRLSFKWLASLFPKISRVILICLC